VTAVHLLVLELVGDRNLAQSTTRAVFAEVFREAPRFVAGRDDVLIWIGAIARDQALALSRTGAGPTPERDLEHCSLSRLALFGRFTHSQLETLLDLPAGSASPRIRRELMNLRSVATSTLPDAAR